VGGPKKAECDRPTAVAQVVSRVKSTDECPSEATHTMTAEGAFRPVMCLKKLRPTLSEKLRSLGGCTDPAGRPGRPSPSRPRRTRPSRGGGRLLPDGDVLGALAGERLALPVLPAVAQTQAGELGHQVQLRRP